MATMAPTPLPDWCWAGIAISTAPPPQAAAVGVFTAIGCVRLVISAFTSVAIQPGGSVLLTGTGPANAGYRLWASTDLSLPFASWTRLTSSSFESNGNFSYTDGGATTNASRFYQLSVP